RLVCAWAGAGVGGHRGAGFVASTLLPVERIVQFCALARSADTGPVLMGAPDDEELALSVTAQTGVANLVGRDRPDLLTALLSELDVVVCGDTGVGHLAAALGTPVVTLFGPTDWRLTAPRGPAEVVRHPTPCSPCFDRTCPIDHPCLRGIAANDVEQRVRRLLAVATERAR